MKRSLFNIFALTSAIVGVLLLGGYVMRFDSSAAYVTPAGPKQTGQKYSLTVLRGFATFGLSFWNLSQTNTLPGMQFESRESYFPIWRSALGPALWGFGVHSYALPGFNVSREYMATCPIWFLETLCLIAPLHWLRARRNREARGFPVIQPEKPPQ